MRGNWVWACVFAGLRERLLQQHASDRRRRVAFASKAECGQAREQGEQHAKHVHVQHRACVLWVVVASGCVEVNSLSNKRTWSTPAHNTSTRRRGDLSLSLSLSLTKPDQRADNGQGFHVVAHERDPAALAQKRQGGAEAA